MFCISCGNELPDNATFCSACGARVRQNNASAMQQVAEPRLYTMKCNACGSSHLKKLRTGEFLCEHCGTIYYAQEQDVSKDDIDQKIVALLSEAEAYSEKGDLQSELNSLAAAYSIAPENKDVLLRYGRSHIKLGFPQKAMDYFRQAEALFPDDPIVYVNIGTALLKQGHYAEAKPQYEKALSIIEVDPLSAPTGDIAVTYGNYALCVGRLGDKRTARKYLALAKEKGYSAASIDWICKELHIPRWLV